MYFTCSAIRSVNMVNWSLTAKKQVRQSRRERNGEENPWDDEVGQDQKRRDKKADRSDGCGVNKAG